MPNRLQKELVFLFNPMSTSSFKCTTIGKHPEGTTDQSGYAFETVDSVEHTLQMFPMGRQDFTIPTGDPAYTSNSSISLPMDLKIWGVFIHILGSGYRDGLNTKMDQPPV